MSEERWLPVVDFEGYYEVSDLGRVRGVDRMSSAGQRLRTRVMKPGLSSSGYVTVMLCRNGIAKSHCIHVLVLTAHGGPQPAGTEVCHNNGSRTDPRLENLRWGTRSANLLDMREHGTHHYASRLTCGYGHKFFGPNLRMRGEKGRICVSCSRARAHCQTHPEADYKTVADRYYTNLMGRAA